MKITKILAVCLAVCIIITLPIYASTTRASEQLHRYGVDVNLLSEELNVTVSVSGTIGVTKTGCEVIRVFEKVGSFWVMREELREDDANMYVNSRIYLYTHTFDADGNSSYRVSVTIFAENADGRDTRTLSYEV
ncbi:MAG TPA: hypothetical protein IAB47_05090 [Candidatus Scatomorpha merdigallinarum]|nr:hypothetical protein [Candidatus Scatomorpha merdigallinarum]